MASGGVRRLWMGYLAVCAALAVARGLVPVGSPAGALITGVYPLMTIVAIVAGVRLNRPARKLPWLLLAGAMATSTLGNLVYKFFQMHGQQPFPSLADVFWLASTPLELAALMLLIRGLSWRRDRAGILDTLMVCGGLGLGLWLLVLRDLVEPGMSLVTQLVTMAYPFADLLLLAGLLRMCVSSARRSPTFWQLTASLAVQSLTDSAWVWQTVHGTDGNALVPGYVLSAMLLGGAALHPSMVAFGAEGTRPAAHITPRRVALIGSACLLSPALLVIDGVVGRDRVSWLAASVCCIAVFLLVLARIAGLVRVVQDQADQLESIAYLDGLTGIPNRRAWDAELERHLAIARRTGDTLVVGVLDLDHFKHYNDRFGHPAGDELLRGAAAVWQRQLRAEDMIARYGGEEFGVILHGWLRDAAVVMDRLREVTPGGQTFSAGLALWTGDESAEQLTARADAALYAAKRDGRDQFMVTGHPARTDLRTDFMTGAAPARGEPAHAVIDG